MELPQGSNIASGPVIIENNKVLLNKEQKEDHVTPWLFPGGGVEDTDDSFEDTCKREVKEELGIDIEILRQLKTLTAEYRGETITLVHYLAKRKEDQEITPGNDVVEWGWHDLDNLPKDCAPNVYEIINELLKN